MLANKRIVLVLLSSIYLGLAGCGGGGGGGDEEPEPSTTPTPTQTPDPTARHSLQGVVFAPAGNAVDGDVNDPFAPYSSNDNFSQAQLIPNPVTIGGYANLPNSGPAGASRLVGDEFDVYRSVLSAGQSISMFVAEDGVTNDLDLAIYDSSGQPVDASLSTDRFESLPIIADGEYFVVVNAHSGFSNYVLVVGLQTAATTGSGMRISDDFVPGEVIANYDQPASGAKLAQAASTLGLSVKAGEPGRNQLLSLSNPSTANLVASASNPAAIELERKLLTLQAIKRLRKADGVRAADPNYIRQPLLVPNDPLYARQWHYPLLNLEETWDITTGNDMIIGVIDTGLVLDHPDIAGQFVGGYDFISDTASSNDGDGIDADPYDAGDESEFDGGGSYHGTHVSGTVAAATNNNTGVAGVAFSARIMPLRALGVLGGTDYDIEQSVRFAAGLPNDSGTVPDRRADVLNLSFGGNFFSNANQIAYNDARQAGVVLVAAAGNSASDVPSYPAAYGGVISVAAVDINKQRATYSNRGSTIDVAAPGGNSAQDINGDGFGDGVLSTAASGVFGSLEFDYPFFQGTSMASPHMAGVVALMRSVNPELTPQDIDNLLAAGELTEDIGTPGRDDIFGHGLINAYKAVVTAANADGGAPVVPVPILQINPTALNMGLATTEATISVSNGGGGDLNVSAPDVSGVSWLTLEQNTDASGLGEYTVRVDREGLGNGLYTASLTFNSNARTLSVPVFMQVSDGLGGAGDSGYHYMILIDPITSNTFQTVPSERRPNGTYTYTFPNVSPGSYQIYGGTDLDNDGLICDAGESCGAYITLDDPATLQVSSDASNLDFSSEFSSGIAISGSSVQAHGGKGISRSPIEKGLE